MSSPTSHTLAYLRRCGHVAEVVERWLPKVNRKRDLFGCIDIVAVRRGEIGVLAVQATSLSNISARLAKARGQSSLSVWLAAGQRFEVHGWYRRNGRWQVKRVELRPGDMQPVVLQAPRRRRTQRQPALFDEGF